MANSYSDWQLFPLADQQGVLGDEALVNEAVQSGAKAATVGDLMTSQASAYGSSLGGTPVSTYLGTLPDTAQRATLVAPTTNAPGQVAPVLSTVRAMSEWVPGETPTHANQYGALEINGKQVKLGMNDIAMSPNLLAKHGLKLGDTVDVLDPKTGKVVYPNQRIADLSYFTANKPTTDSIELWGRPDLGHAQIRRASGSSVASGGAPTTGSVASANYDYIPQMLASTTLPQLPSDLASTKPTETAATTAKKEPAKEPASRMPMLVAPPPAQRASALSVASMVPEPVPLTQAQQIAANRARLRLPKVI